MPFPPWSRAVRLPNGVDPPLRRTRCRKTETGRWLATEHCYVHVETDVEWATWGQALCTADILAGATTVRNRVRALGPDVVIEWGFRVKLLPCVRQLRMVGFETWWLDGDEGAARQVYLQRRGTSADVIQAYEAQVQSIEAARRSSTPSTSTAWAPS